MIPTKFMTKFSRSTDLYGKGSVHINSRNLTSHPMRHATCWYGFKRTEVDQSCFKTFTGLRSGSLKYAPARQFAGKWQNPTLEKKKKKKKKKKNNNNSRN